MLIKALCDYYDAIQDDDQESLTGECYSKQRVSYMIFLGKDGLVSDIVDIRDEERITTKKGTKVKYNPVDIILPKRSQKTSIDLNIIEHRPLYIFGLNYADGKLTPNDKTNKAKKSHECFVKGNLEFCKDIDSEIVTAYKNFLEKWDPENETQNDKLVALGKEYASSYYCFALEGHPEIKLHEDELLKRKFEKEFSKQQSSTDEVLAMCPIEGEVLPTARIHDKIKGLSGGNSTGGVLVGVKDNAYESYGKSQSYNSSISERAMKKYTASLNSLLSSKNHKINFPDMNKVDNLTIIFFAIKKNDENECYEFIDALMENPKNSMDDSLKSIAKEIEQGRTGGALELNTDDEVTFYVAGLTPNSSRISQKFVVRDSFGSIMKNIRQHQIDMAVSEDEDAKQVKLWWILKELISPKSSKESVPAPLTSRTIMAILRGIEYPQALLGTVVRRIKLDSDEENNHFIKFNDTRVGIIKACINRKNRLTNKKEEIKLSLDRQNTNPAYLCGRLFAVIEKLQIDAAGTKLNRTIKDSYFAAACARPSSVMPRLIQLSNYHVSKLSKSEGKNSGVYCCKMISEIMDSLGEAFPKTLSLEDQGRFIIGYYQQNKDLFTSKLERNGEE